ncbi:MAG: hypothetical protein ACK6CT_12175, partial [Planctomycetia bacterium]
ELQASLKQSQVVLHDKGQVACGHRRPLAFRRLTAILVPLSEDAIALAAAAVKNGNWAAGSDLFGHTFGKGGSWETFEKFLEHEKMYPTTRPHYQLFLDRYEGLRPKK